MVDFRCFLVDGNCEWVRNFLFLIIALPLLSYYMPTVFKLFDNANKENTDKTIIWIAVVQLFLLTNSSYSVYIRFPNNRVDNPT
jgi:hypothetical protein